MSIKTPIRCWLGLALIMAASQALAGDALRSRYILNCAGCHGFDGSGAKDNGVPSMKGVIGHFLRLPQGRSFLVQVPGSSQSSLTDAQLAESLNWMVKTMAEKSMPENFVPYTEKEVTRLRNSRPENIMDLRAKIVTELKAKGYEID